MSGWEWLLSDSGMGKVLFTQQKSQCYYYHADIFFALEVLKKDFCTRLIEAAV